MSKNSNNYGRAFEYACLIKLFKDISVKRRVKIEKNSSFEASKKAWNSISDIKKESLNKGAKSAVNIIFSLEPLILEKDNEEEILQIQPDYVGQSGDVRDILITRQNIKWTIGLSVKHNHFAVKHSRIAKDLDFSKKWFNNKNSQEYWNSVSGIFNKLEDYKKQRKLWNQLNNKYEEIYIPLLNSFIDEIKRQYKSDKNVPNKMVKYLLGKFDFYKVISVDVKKATQIQSYNLYGTLNKPSKLTRPSTIIPIVDLPTRIVNIGIKPNSNNTVELYMDNGWQFSFRIHNAEKFVCPSLKFDIQIIGIPATIVTINSFWL